MTTWSMLFWNNKVLGNLQLLHWLSVLLEACSLSWKKPPQVPVAFPDLFYSVQSPGCNWSLLLFIYYCVSVPPHEITGQKNRIPDGGDFLHSQHYFSSLAFPCCCIFPHKKLWHWKFFFRKIRSQYFFPRWTKSVQCSAIPDLFFFFFIQRTLIHFCTSYFTTCDDQVLWIIFLVFYFMCVYIRRNIYSVYF